MGEIKISKSFSAGNLFVTSDVLVMYSKMRMPGWGKRAKVRGSTSDFTDQSAAWHFFLSILKATQSIG